MRFQVNLLCSRINKCAVYELGFTLDDFYMNGLATTSHIPSVDNVTLKNDTINSCRGRIQISEAGMMYVFRVSTRAYACNGFAEVFWAWYCTKILEFGQNDNDVSLSALIIFNLILIWWLKMHFTWTIDYESVSWEFCDWGHNLCISKSFSRKMRHILFYSSFLWGYFITSLYSYHVIMWSSSDFWKITQNIFLTFLKRPCLKNVHFIDD